MNPGIYYRTDYNWVSTIGCVRLPIEGTPYHSLLYLIHYQLFMYIKSINHFRGIAILFIVFGHCLNSADFKYDSVLGNTIFNLTMGGTSFFVFISGFLFHHIFHKNFIYKKFMVTKIKYVLLPYLILSSLPIIYLLVRVCIAGILSSSTFSPLLEDLLSFPVLAHYLIGVGRIYTGYWYIPFIMVVFAISPIFMRFIKLSLQNQILTTIFLLICSVFMHRGPFQNATSVFQSTLFFTPVYLLGIISSEKKDIIYSKLTGKEFYILIIIILLAGIQVCSGKLGSYFKDPFTFEGIDLMVIQKIIFCLFFMVFLNRFENYKFKLLEIIANNSFGVYFIHGIVLYVLAVIKSKSGFSFPPDLFVIYLLVSLFVFFISLAATLFIKRIFPKYSRYLIGS